MAVNKLILGDNLEIMRQMDENSIDLIYLDPPFFSNRNYEVIWGDDGEKRSFIDRWSGGIDHYITWLFERVKIMHRLLKPTGSIFLHCDWHANAYIRVDILDKIFGFSNFNSEIIWVRSFGTGSSKGGANKIPVNVDTIFFYSKDKSDFTFNVQKRPLNEGAIKRYDKIDGDGRRYFWADMRTYSQERLDELLERGEAKISPNAKNPRYKKYFDEAEGTPLDTLWSDIEFIGTKSKERIGYPTQKPVALLERIIKMATNVGDTVLDPFVGGGTTVAVADKLNRQWIGIDQSTMAVKVSELRLNKQKDLYCNSYINSFSVQLHKYDYDTLRSSNAFEFETWIIQQFGGIANAKQRNDFGLDGRMPDGTPIQVKRSDDITRSIIDNFKSSIERCDKRLMAANIANEKPAGFLIAFTFGRGAIQEVARLKNDSNIIIKLVRVDEIVPISKKPTITVDINELSQGSNFHEIEFVASAHSNAGIEFFSWDFEHNPADGFRASIIIDKEGKQRIKLNPGQHTIAVKVVDNDGLESIETLKLKVNGTVERN